jgi:mRNA-degrading endonuclease YafQ of YafQ-DinJ toxin-antitoxin module
MHLGAELSLLTSLKNDPQTGKPQVDPQSASPVLQNLVFCLADLIRCNEDQDSKPTLILLGDILELALANDNVAAMVFWRFIEIAMEPDHELFGNILYIPGNHDHHLWESARETQYVLHYLPGKEVLEDPSWHATDIFMNDDPNPVPSFFLTALLKRFKNLKDMDINTAYPNFGLMKGNRSVIFHHGHFIESIYQLMTTFKNLIFPDHKDLTRMVWDLEAENFAWIDFFWSTLGRSGEFGKDVEIIYDRMQDEAQFRNLVENLATGLAAQYGISDHNLLGWLGQTITKKIVDFVVHKLVYPERKVDQLLSDDAETGLQDYVNGPLKLQIEKEWHHRQHLDFPDEITFVFGHTHKPFEAPKTFTKIGNGVPVYNTGGWVVETVKPAHVHGGAVVLLNENLDVVSLRMYNEADGLVDVPVEVEVHEQPLPGNKNSSFFTEVNDRIQANQDLWDKFSQELPDELRVRRKILQDKINS